MKSVLSRIKFPRLAKLLASRKTLGPRDYGSPVKIFFLNAELIRIHRAMLTYWTPKCVAKRTIELDCEHWQKYPDIESNDWNMLPWERFHMDPRNRELPFICKAEKTIQFMTPIEP